MDGDRTMRDQFAMDATEEDIVAFLPQELREEYEFIISKGWIKRLPLEEEYAGQLRAAINPYRGRMRAWARYQFAEEMMKQREKK